MCVSVFLLLLHEMIILMQKEMYFVLAIHHVIKNQQDNLQTLNGLVELMVLSVVIKRVLRLSWLKLLKYNLNLICFLAAPKVCSIKKIGITMAIITL